MWDKLAEIKESALKLVAGCEDIDSINDARVSLLGKKGQITSISRMMGQLSQEERPKIGQEVNAVKKMVEEAIESRMTELKKLHQDRQLARERIDISLDGRKCSSGSTHILSIVTEEMEDIFLGMGFSVVEGPQVETDYFNFEAMNIPKEHPAREMQDSFYFTNNLLLRTHTSPVQARTMQKMNGALPVKVISPGVVYRRDDDATHSPMFHQVEGLVVDKRVTLADLKGTLLAFARQMFGQEREIRLRPSYFPFTEPSVEIDVSCFNCGGAGCRLCKGSGWIEILGSGIVHPNVLRMSGYDPDEVSGYAFGMGVERIAMLKYGITDMRLLFDNDMRFLSGFDKA